LNVEASITTRRGTRAAAIAVTVVASAEAFGRLVIITGALAAGASKRAPAPRIDVVADHPPAGGMKVMRESSAHDAETDDPDNAFPLCCHCRFQLLWLRLFEIVTVILTDQRYESVIVVF